jgi:hypothetical protein
MTARNSFSPDTGYSQKAIVINPHILYIYCTSTSAMDEDCRDIKISPLFYNVANSKQEFYALLTVLPREV